MSSWFKANPIRLGWVLLLAAVIVIQARAQFKLPKMPNVPGPRLPGFGGNQGVRPDNNELLQSGKNFLDMLDLDNPKRQEDLGQSIAVAISNRYPVSRNRALNEYVNLVGLTVASVSPKPELKFAFGVLETNDVGAYSTPGGYVFVTRGALALMNDESELAGVLAHEVAHVVANHGIEAVKKASLAPSRATSMKAPTLSW
jgi:predicted Zn-dependent protease